MYTQTGLPVPEVISLAPSTLKSSLPLISTVATERQMSSETWGFGTNIANYEVDQETYNNS